MTNTNAICFGRFQSFLLMVVQQLVVISCAYDESERGE